MRPLRGPLLVGSLAVVLAGCWGMGDDPHPGAPTPRPTPTSLGTVPVGATPPPTGAPSVLPTDAPTVGPSNGQTPTFGFVLSGTQPGAVSPIPGSDPCHVLIDARSRTWTASFIAASADGRRWEIEVRTRTGAYRGPGTYTAVADEVRASVQVRDDTGDGWGGAATAGQLLINGPDPVSGVVDITVRAHINSRLPDGSVEQVTGGFDCVDARVIE